MPRGVHDGPRGRKPAAPEDKGKPTTVWLTPADREALEPLLRDEKDGGEGLSLADVMRLGIKQATKARNRRG